MLGEDVLDHVSTGPSGLPCTFGMDGQPITAREAAELYEDLNERTLAKTDIMLPGGTPAQVRTLCLVFDHGLATCSLDELGEKYVPQVFASACYWGGEDMRECVQPLWTYGSPEEARAGHPEAVDEFVSGRARVQP